MINVLDVNVAEWIRKCTHHIANGTIGSEDAAEIQDIRESSIAAWRCVVDGDGSGNGLCQIGVESLPNPEYTVNHGVMKPEGRLVGRREDIRRLTADTGVTGSVEAQEGITEAALELGLKVIDAVAGSADGDVGQVGQCEELVKDQTGQVTAQAARVVAELTSRAGVEAAHGWSDWAKMQFNANEGSVLASMV